MLKDSYSFSEFGFSSQLIRDLVEENKKVEPFINSFFSEEVINKQAEKKTFTLTQRKTLVESLKSQNKDIPKWGQGEKHAPIRSERTVSGFAFIFHISHVGMVQQERSDPKGRK